jgi:hypothetical protein
VSRSACAGCRAAIEWAETVERESVAVDPARVLVVEDDAGPLRMVLKDRRVVSARLAQPGEHGVLARATHVSTCPHPERIRRARRATAS